MRDNSIQTRHGRALISWDGQRDVTTFELREHLTADGEAVVRTNFVQAGGAGAVSFSYSATAERRGVAKNRGQQSLALEAAIGLATAAGELQAMRARLRAMGG